MQLGLLCLQSGVLLLQPGPLDQRSHGQALAIGHGNERNLFIEVDSLTNRCAIGHIDDCPVGLNVTDNRSESSLCCWDVGSPVEYTLPLISFDAPRLPRDSLCEPPSRYLRQNQLIR